MENIEVDLGFAEKNENKFDLTTLHYPSKLGGRPAWLRWDQLISQKCIQCDSCNKQMIFLCQLFVPIQRTINEKGLSYHKMVYLFCCLDGSCYKKGLACVKAFRALKIENDDDLTDKDLDKKTDQELSVILEKIESQQPLCDICGCYGEKKCSGCHKVSYCSKEHQVFDWKKCGHSTICKSGKEPNQKQIKTSPLFPEYEIVIESEPEVVEERERNDQENAKYEEYLNKLTGGGGSIDKSLEKEFSKLTASTVDECFMKFKERTQREPDQIIRYDVGGEPLWVSSENILSKDQIPRCVCGAERQFEFQILPQMLNYLETTLDSIDWGTLCVYTCVENCDSENFAYAEEFVWKQDFSSTDIS